MYTKLPLFIVHKFTHNQKLEPTCTFAALSININMNVSFGTRIEFVDI